MSKQIGQLLTIVATALTLSGCWNVRGFHAATANPLGTKTGEACSTLILGLFADGDASSATAARRAGINKISTVDFRVNSILGVYTTYCTVVSGE